MGANSMHSQQEWRMILFLPHLHYIHSVDNRRTRRTLQMLVCCFTPNRTDGIRAKNGNRTPIHQKYIRYKREWRILLQHKPMAINFVVTLCSSDKFLRPYIGSVQYKYRSLSIHAYINYMMVVRALCIRLEVAANRWTKYTLILALYQNIISERSMALNILG